MNMVRFKLRPLQRFGITLQVLLPPVFLNMLVALAVARLFVLMRGNLGHPPNQLLIPLCLLLPLSALSLLWLFTRLRLAFRESFFGTYFEIDDIKLVKHIPSNESVACQWRELSCVYNGPDSHYGLTHVLFGRDLGTRLEFRGATTILLTPDGAGTARAYHPLLKAAAQASGSGSPLWKSYELFELRQKRGEVFNLDSAHFYCQLPVLIMLILAFLAFNLIQIALFWYVIIMVLALFVSTFIAIATHTTLKRLRGREQERDS